MKKIEKLKKQLDVIQKKIDLVSFERKDSSYRRSGGYFGTDKANLNDVIVVKSYSRTKHLNTYICVDKIHNDLVLQLKEAQNLVDLEYKRLFKISQNNWAKTSIDFCRKRIAQDIEDGTIFTNYHKTFHIGNKNIYAAHPYYGHSDYNKWCAMPNTPKHRKVAEELNKLIEEAKNSQKVA